MATGEPLWETIDERIEVHDHDIPDPGGYRGHEGVGAWLENWGAAWAEYTVEARDYIDAGDAVIAVLLLKAKGRGSGVELEREDGMLCAMDGGRIVRIDYYNSKAQALEAAGLAPSR